MVSRKRASVGVSEPHAKYLVKAQPAPKAGTKAAARRALLDVNVLIALLDADHLHHTRAAAWLAENIKSGWASCAITQNGCVRIMSQPGYPNALPAAGVAQRLREATLADHHLFIAGDVSLLDEQHFDAPAFETLDHFECDGFRAENLPRTTDCENSHVLEKP